MKNRIFRRGRQTQLDTQAMALAFENTQADVRYELWKQGQTQPKDAAEAQKFATRYRRTLALAEALKQMMKDARYKTPRAVDLPVDL